MARIEETLVNFMAEKKLTLAIAESITCGNAASRLSTVKKLGDVFIGSIVTYSPESKGKLLHVSEKTMCDFTCESAEVTCEMTKGLAKIIDADIHVAITGLAAPGGSESDEKPVGTVFYCLLYQDKFTHIRKHFNGDPLEIMNQACEKMYELIIKLIEEHEENHNLAR